MTVMRPLPGIMTPSMVEQFAADLGPGEPGHDADLILGFGLAIAEARHAEIVRNISAVTFTVFVDEDSVKVDGGTFETCLDA